MSQNYNLIKNEEPTSLSMMTFKDYYMTFIGIKEPYLANGWGWFVDIELNSEPIRVNTSNKYKPFQYISVLKTIHEYPSIRSMKSMKNLHDTSMIFEMDDYDMKHRTNSFNFGNLITHTLGIIGIVVCYFITC